MRGICAARLHDAGELPVEERQVKFGLVLEVLAVADVGG